MLCGTLAFHASSQYTMILSENFSNRLYFNGNAVYVLEERNVTFKYYVMLFYASLLFLLCKSNKLGPLNTYHDKQLLSQPFKRSTVEDLMASYDSIPTFWSKYYMASHLKSSTLHVCAVFSVRSSFFLVVTNDNPQFDVLPAHGTFV
jgi:hypothetical protein